MYLLFVHFLINAHLGGCNCCAEIPRISLLSSCTYLICLLRCFSPNLSAASRGVMMISSIKNTALKKYKVNLISSWLVCTVCHKLPPVYTRTSTTAFQYTPDDVDELQTIAQIECGVEGDECWCSATISSQIGFLFPSVSLCLQSVWRSKPHRKKTTTGSAFY